MLIRKLIAVLSIGLGGVAQAGSQPPFVHTLDRPFNEYTWLTTHNAFNYYLTPVPNQTIRMPEQLKAGVRALMLDLVEHRDGIYVCHSVCLGSEMTLEATLSTVILPFLEEHPSEVITLHVEGDVSRNKLHLALNRVRGLSKLTFKPDNWSTSDWPTLRQMADANQRLLVFHLNANLSGNYTLDDGTAHIMASTSGTVENYWSLGDTIFSHDYGCRSRWQNIPLDRMNVDFPGKNWPRLFVMNQFHGVGERLHARTDNRFDRLLDRTNNYCSPAAKRPPNFIAIDHFEQGDAMAFAAVLSQGGVIFYEGNGGRQDIVCGVPGRVNILANLKKGGFKGCENDEARSARIINLPKGTKITVYDSPDGKHSDDYTVITLRRDVSELLIPSFESSSSNADRDMVFHRHNGLDGKISRIEIEPPRQ